MIAFQRILRLVLEPKNQPVLFDCHGGRHRTGMIAMAIQYIQGVPQNKVEENYAYYARPLEWYHFSKNESRPENIKFMRKFIQTDLFKELRDKYQLSLK